MKVPKVQATRQPRRDAWRDIEERIVSRYSMLLNTTQLGAVIGIRNYDRIRAWAEGEGIEPIRFGFRDKWDSRDVAKAIYYAKGR